MLFKVVNVYTDEIMCYTSTIEEAKDAAKRYSGWFNGIDFIISEADNENC